MATGIRPPQRAQVMDDDLDILRARARDRARENAGEQALRGATQRARNTTATEVMAQTVADRAEGSEVNTEGSIPEVMELTYSHVDTSTGIGNWGTVVNNRPTPSVSPSTRTRKLTKLIPIPKNKDKSLDSIVEGLKGLKLSKKEARLSNLSIEQRWIYENREDMDKINKAGLIATDATEYKVLIIKVENIDAEDINSITFTMNFTFPDSSFTATRGINWMSVKRLPKAYKDKYKGLDEQMVLNRMVNGSIAIRDKKIQNIKGELGSLESRITNHRASIVGDTKRTKTIKNQLDNIGEYKVDQNHIVSQMQLLRKHEMIDNISITRDNHILILTKMLEAVDREDGKPYIHAFGKKVSSKIGRFMIEINHENIYFDEYSIQAKNLDYLSQGHDHPNIRSGTICMGNTEDQFRDMFTYFQVYQLTDLLITLITTWGENDEEPWVDFDEWLDEKQDRTKREMATMLKDYRERIVI